MVVLLGQKVINRISIGITTRIYGLIGQAGMESSKQILTIQYLRGLAALAVVAAHAGALSFRGQAGVDVFFVISGFIMWTITKGTPDIFLFLKNRILRIVPLYWIATILMGVHQKASWLAIAKSMLFIPFIGESDQIWPVLVQGWTLNYEMFFYVLVAVSLLISGTPRFVLILSMIGLLSGVGMWHRSANPILATYTDPLLVEFAFGIILAELRFRTNPVSLRLAVLLGLAAVALFCLSPGDRLPGVYRFASWGVPSALVVASALLFESAGWVRRVGLLLLLGDASYAIYLFHTFVVKTVLRIFGGMGPVIDTVAVLFCASMLGVLIALFVEKPLLGMLRGSRKIAPV